MNADDATCLAISFFSSLLSAWPALRLARSFRETLTAGLVGFVCAYAFALLVAWAIGVGLDVAGEKYNPTPVPGNFVIPLPWPLVLPMAQILTFGPVAGLAVGIAAAIISRRNAATLRRGESQ
jgi:ABC-type antimicrobial peptide transport system permease subunit